MGLMGRTCHVLAKMVDTWRLVWYPKMARKMGGLMKIYHDMSESLGELTLLILAWRLDW